MKIAVLCGSPKGDNSVTKQYLYYIEKNFKENTFKFFDIGNHINKIETDADYFKGIINEIRGSDCIVWSTPVFVFLVPSQLKRFIEIIYERKETDAFEGKYATAFTTSVNFFDFTAHNYLRAISEDLNMSYIDGYSSEMEDLLKEDERKRMLKFARNFFAKVSDKEPTGKYYNKITQEIPVYNPGEINDEAKTYSKNIILLTDADESNANLKNMTDVFLKLMPNKVEVINITTANIKGGCLSCYHCSYDGQCLYNDDFFAINQKLLEADAIIFAGNIKDRYISSRWKMFQDRLYVNNHSPVFQNKQFAYIISGNLRHNSNLKEIIYGTCDVGRSNLAGIVTDEYENSNDITSLIKGLAKNIMWGINEEYMRPTTFFGVGAHKLFRDFIYNMRWFFRNDHNFYKKHGYYDFPKNDIKTFWTNFSMSLLMAFPDMRKRIYKGSEKEMLKAYKKILEN